MTGHHLDVNGTRLFVDDRGDEGAPALLFIHGGPGQSCYDFMYAQGDRMARQVRIIGVDQRGVLRSDDLPPEPALSVDLLIADYEEIRSQLGIARWGILGHSAGGAYALEYAVAHPGSVTAAVYDCPCWDCDLTDRHRLPVAAERLAALGKTDAASACLSLATKPDRITADDESWVAVQALGEEYMSLFFLRPEGPAEYAQIMDSGGFTEAQRRRGMSHLPLLADMYDSKLHLLGAVEQPSLLIHGRQDLVVPPDVVQLFKETVDGGDVHTLQQSGHFAYHEEADAYSQIVSGFVVQHAR